MAYVVVDSEGKPYRTKGWPWSYGLYPYSLGGAKCVATRLHKMTGQTYQVLETEEYRKLHPVKIVKRTNLLTGKEFEIEEDAPACCDPSTETYWGM